MNPIPKKAVILLSGGLDSATILAMAADQGFDCYALSFRYGQRHAVELEAAAHIAARARVVEHKIVEIDLRAFGGSALTDDIPVPKNTDVRDLGSDIPITYVPARNTIFLSFALGYAEVVCSTDIFIGVNAVDYSGYPDCRPDFIGAFEALADLATKAGVEGHKMTIHAPLIHMSKAEIITEGSAYGIDYSATISCYDPDDSGRACGGCDSCLLREQGFRNAGQPDPTRYQG